MKDYFQITVIFDPQIILETKSKANKIIYSKNPDEKKKNKLIEKLEKKAAEDSLKFNRRQLSSLFIPVFNGCILFPDETDLTFKEIEELINFGDLFFERIEENLGIDIVNYSLIDLKSEAKAKGHKPHFFDFEIFNYNFDTHRLIKSEFIKAPNIRKVSKIAEAVLTEKKPAAREREKRLKKMVTLMKEKSTVKTVKQPNVPEPKIAAEVKIKQVKGKGAKEKAGEGGKKMELDLLVTTGYAEKLEPEPKVSEPGVLAGEIPEICETEHVEQGKNISEQIGLISLNWSLLSPAENIPLLETGEPVEISGESLVRIYFQKPNVRQVVWRFRKKPKAESSKPILRVYGDADMLWYEVLDGQLGSRYIIFPEGLELSQTWVEIGYLTEKGDFIFIARSPVWPPTCLLQKLPKLKLERNIEKGTVLIGATESIPGGMRLPVNITSSGAGFSASGAGFSASGAGLRKP